jgi:hypothetical protein
VSLNNVRAVAEGYSRGQCTSRVREMLGIGRRGDAPSLHGQDIPLGNWGRGFIIDSDARKISGHIRLVNVAAF